MWENSSSGELGVCWRKTRIHGNGWERDPWGSWRELEKREWAKRRKNWDFFTVLGVHWDLLEKGGRKSLLGFISRREFLPCSPEWAGAALPCGKLRKTQLVWRKPTGNPAGTGLVYLEKGKSGMRGGTSGLLGLVWPKSIGFTPWNGNKIGEPPIWGILPRLAGRGLIGSQCCRESALICIFA